MCCRYGRTKSVSTNKDTWVSILLNLISHYQTGPVINMATSKTEIAYVTCTDEELDFSKPMNPSPYINVLRLYKRKMVRVPNPII
jgi:hypothetical protein